MSNQLKVPDPEARVQSVAKMQELCKRWDKLIQATEDLIVQLDEQIRQQPNEIYRLKRRKQVHRN
jgi:hypothetical protein